MYTFLVINFFIDTEILLSSVLFSGLVALFCLLLYITVVTVLMFNATGSYPRSMVIRFFSLCLRDDLQLNTVYGLVDVGLAIHLIMTGTLMHVSWSYGLRAFRTYQTEVSKKKYVCVV